MNQSAVWGRFSLKKTSNRHRRQLPHTVRAPISVFFDHTRKPNEVRNTEPCEIELVETGGSIRVYLVNPTFLRGNPFEGF